MKRVLLSLLLFISLAVVAQQPRSSESVDYKIMYKWGLINKQAGRATVTIKEIDSVYHTQLIARTEKWADRFYKVRDTLNGIILKDGFRPQFYEKIAHESSDDKHDIVHFSYRGDEVIGQCTRIAYKDGKLRRNEQKELTATGKVVDMLSSYYYMRGLPFENWEEGHEHSVTIFSGKQKEKLTLKYQGKETVEVEDKKYDCFHVTFIFTSSGGKKTSDDMDAWITTDKKRTAVRLEGKLPIGKVRCIIK